MASQLESVALLPVGVARAVCFRRLRAVHLNLANKCASMFDIMHGPTVVNHLTSMAAPQRAADSALCFSMRFSEIWHFLCRRFVTVHVPP